MKSEWRRFFTSGVGEVGPGDDEAGGAGGGVLEWGRVSRCSLLERGLV